MNAEAILNKIGEDARESAAQLKADAEKKADALRAASRARIEKEQKALLSQAEKDADELHQRMERMSELDSRKELLGKKRALIDEAFAQSLAKLASAPAGERRAFFLRQATACAVGGETLMIGAKNADWFDERFAQELNAALVSAGKPGQITLSPERRAGQTGLILAAEGAETQCTFETLLESARPEIEAQVAAVLFG